MWNRSFRALFIVLALLPWLTWALLLWVPGAPVGHVLCDLFGRQCHQEPWRSPNLWGVQVPLCARCLGIYAGLGVAGLLGVAIRSSRLAVYAILAGAVVLGVDVLSEALGLRGSTAVARAATGVVFSLPVAAAVLGATAKCAPSKILGSNRGDVGL